MSAKIKPARRKASRSLEPQQLSENDWYYEKRGQLLLVHQVHTKDGSYVQTDQVKIPWRKIETSLKRVKAAKRRRAAKVQS